MSEKIDPKYVKHLKFRYSESKVVERDGRKVKEFIPKERQMKVEDVLSWRDYGDHVVVVTADGQKVKVDKSTGKPVEETTEEEKENKK